MITADELIAAYLVGELADAERLQLQELLRHDPAARQRFARLCRDDVVLREVARTAPSSQRRERTATPRRGRRIASPRLVRGRRRVSAIPLWTMAALAAGLAVAVIVLMQPRQSVVPSSSATMVAEILSAGDSSLVDGRPLVAGERLAAGVTLTARSDVSVRLLADGSELTLTAGARVRLAAGEVRAHLEQGRITARVAPQRTGRFTIVAPQASATVLGTVFTLDADGVATRLAVDEGLVRFAPLTGSVVEVSAGAGATADAGGLTGLVRGFALIDAGRDVPIGTATLGQLDIAHAAIPVGGISLRIDCAPEIRAVRIDAQGPHGPAKGVAELEQEVPFALTGNIDGDYKPWHPTPGTYRISVRPYLDDDGRKPAGAATSVVLTITP